MVRDFYYQKCGFKYWTANLSFFINSVWIITYNFYQNSVLFYQKSVIFSSKSRSTITFQEIEGVVEIDECRQCETIANAYCESSDLINRVEISIKNGHAIPECRYSNFFVATDTQLVILPPHNPKNRARRGYTVVILLYDLCCGRGENTSPL